MSRSRVSVTVDYWRAFRGGAEFFFLLSGDGETFPVRVYLLRKDGSPESLLVEVDLRCDDGGYANLTVAVPDELRGAAKALRLESDRPLGEFPVPDGLHS